MFTSGKRKRSTAIKQETYSISYCQNFALANILLNEN